MGILEIMIILRILSKADLIESILTIQNDIKEFNRTNTKAKERKVLIIQDNVKTNHHSKKRKIDVYKKLNTKRMLKEVFFVDNLSKYDENSIQKVIEWYRPIRWIGDRNKNRDKIRKSEKEMKNGISRILKEGIDNEELRNTFEEDGIRLWTSRMNKKDKKKVYNNLERELKDIEEKEKNYRIEISKTKVENLKMMISVFDPCSSEEIL